MINYYVAIVLCSFFITMLFDSLFDLYYYKRKMNKPGYFRTLICLFIYVAALLQLIQSIFTH